MDIVDLLMKSMKAEASDIHITVGIPPVFRVHGKLLRLGSQILTKEDTLLIVKQILRTEEQMEYLEKTGEIDVSFSERGIGRYRVNIYKQRGVYGVALRSIPLDVPTIDSLGLPQIFKSLAMKQRGLILITGPTGSGKSTTLAALVRHMNENRNAHVITIEDPIEYLHRHNKSMINQREIGNDSGSFAAALRAALRQDPDVILVGEMRDLETISTAITAAETGHLVLSTLHTVGSAKTADRIIDVFPPFQQVQIRTQLASVLEGIVSQQILPRIDADGRVVAFEIMMATSAVRNLIREGKTHQLQTVIETGYKFGMKTMDADLLELYTARIIDKENLLKHSVDYDAVMKQIEFR